MELDKLGISYEKHYKGIRGTPDIAIPEKKLAIFVDGDFWHGYRYTSWKKRLNSDFWTRKIERNIARDKRTFAYLRRHGWKVLRVWEHQVTKELVETLKRVRLFLDQQDK